MHSPNGFFFYSFHSSPSSSYPSSSFSPTKFLPPSIHIVSAAPRSKLFTHQNNLQPCRTTPACSVWIVSPQTQLQQHYTGLPLDTATPAKMWRVSSLSSHPPTLIMSVSACGPWYQKKSLYPSLTGNHASRASIVLSAARVSLLHFLITASCSPLELSMCLSVSDMTPRRKSGPASGHRLCMGGLRMTGPTRRSISTMAESSLWYICWRIGRILLFGSASLMSLRTSFSSPASGSRYVSFTVVQQEILKPRDPLFTPCWRMLACFLSHVVRRIGGRESTRPGTCSTQRLRNGPIMKDCTQTSERSESLIFHCRKRWSTRTVVCIWCTTTIQRTSPSTRFPSLTQLRLHPQTAKPLKDPPTSDLSISLPELEAILLS